MFFGKLSLRNFGSFDQFDMTFKEGMNVICGDNGAGKTQLVGAVVAALIGKSAVRINAAGTGPSTVNVSLHEEGVAEDLMLTVSLDREGHPHVEQHLATSDDGNPAAPLGERLRAMLSNPDAPRLLLRRDPGRWQPLPLVPHRVESLLPDSLRQSQSWLDIRANGMFRDARASGGQQSLGMLLDEFVVRRTSKQNPPLIVEEFFETMSHDMLDFPRALLESLAETTQVIVLTNNRVAFPDHPMTMLERASAETSSLAYYNYLLELQRPHLPIRKRPKWIKGHVFPEQETRACELKEVKGENPLAAIKGVVDQYVVAFLNAGTPQEGAIYWGVRDEDRAITGVNLTDRECDELRRVVTEKLHQITPSLAPTRYRIELHPISDGVQAIRGLYLVEIRIPSIRQSLLFATGSQEVYVKTDSGKKKLTALQIQQELLHRYGIDHAS